MWRTNQSKDILENVTLRVPSRNISFEKLEKYTNYTIQILAFTVKGDGQISEQVVVTTDEDSKSRTSLICLMKSYFLLTCFYIQYIEKGY